VFYAVLAESNSALENKTKRRTTMSTVATNPNKTAQKPRRSWAPEEKMQIVIEGLSRKTTVEKVCKQHGLHQTQYFEWRKQLVDSAPRIFGPGGQAPSQDRQEVEKLREDLDRCHELVVHLVSENLLLHRA